MKKIERMRNCTFFLRLKIRQYRTPLTVSSAVKFSSVSHRFFKWEPNRPLARRSSFLVRSARIAVYRNPRPAVVLRHRSVIRLVGQMVITSPADLSRFNENSWSIWTVNNNAQSRTVEMVFIPLLCQTYCLPKYYNIN